MTLAIVVPSDRYWELVARLKRRGMTSAAALEKADRFLPLAPRKDVRT